MTVQRVGKLWVAYSLLIAHKTIIRFRRRHLRRSFEPKSNIRILHYSNTKVVFESCWHYSNTSNHSKCNSAHTDLPKNNHIKAVWGRQLNQTAILRQIMMLCTFVCRQRILETRQNSFFSWLLKTFRAVFGYFSLRVHYTCSIVTLTYLLN